MYSNADVPVDDVVVVTIRVYEVGAGRPVAAGPDVDITKKLSEPSVKHFETHSTTGRYFIEVVIHIVVAEDSSTVPSEEKKAAVTGETGSDHYRDIVLYDA